MVDDDALDAPDFDPVDYLNHHFPTERSLDRLEPFMSKVAVQIGDLDDEISKTVQAQSEAGHQASRDVDEAKAAIRELFEKIRDMKAKAEQSEVMVQEICRDIKQLDFAKRHLQTTITALKRLHMLVTAVDQLQGVAKAKQYRESANLLDAVRQLLTHFESYAEVPRIAELRETVTVIKNGLVEQTSQAFNQVGQLASSTADPEGFQRDADKPGQFRSLQEACLVVDALGGQARQQQIECFCNQQMQPYGPLFPQGSMQAQLDQVDRRFAWFRRLLRGVDLRFDGVFPKHWLLQHRLCIRFLVQTRTDLAEILEGGSKEAEDVTVLLKSVHKCLGFENEAHSRFEAKEDGNRPATQIRPAEGDLSEPTSAEAVKRQYANLSRGHGRDATSVGHGSQSLFATLSANGEGVKDEVEGALPAIMGMLSGVFEPFMGPYIAFERRNLDDLIKAATRTVGPSDDDIDRDRKLPVFSTSVNIFVYIKNSIQRCTKFTTGQTFFELHHEYKSCLRAYANLLQAKLPNSQGSAALQQHLVDDGEVAVCYVVNTAEYCADILPQLEDMIKGKMGASFAEKVDLAEEQEPYYNVITQAVRVLVSGLESRVEPAFRAMSAINWGSCEMVGEESLYVRSIHDAFQSFVPNIRSLLSTLYFRRTDVVALHGKNLLDLASLASLTNLPHDEDVRQVLRFLRNACHKHLWSQVDERTNFCDKMVTSFLPSFLSLILRQRRVNEMGTQQLLLDVYNLKTLMLKVPSLGLDPLQATPIPASYTKYVTKHMSKIEMVLKLVGTPQAMLVERFQIMWPDGSASDLQAIMTLKGMRKADQQVILEGSFGTDSEPPATARTRQEPVGTSVTPLPESGPLGAARLAVPNFETNTREIASKMESSMRNMTSNLQKLSFR